MKPLLPLSLATACLLALAACKPQDNAPSSTPATPAATDTQAPAETAAPAIDVALAGRFKGELPCASCPGIDTTLTLAPDGSYTLQETYKEEMDGNSETKGRWEVREGTLVLLAAEGDAAGERRYAVDSNDALTQLTAEGKKPDGALNYTLTRQAP